MKTRLLVSLGLVGLLLFALIRFIGTDAGEGRQADLAPAPTASGEPEPGPKGADVDELELSELPSESEDGVAQPREVVSSEPEEEAVRSWPAEETRWIEVSVIAPAETPTEERTWVVALGAETGAKTIHGKKGPLVQLHNGTDPARIEGILAATLTDAAGQARLGLPPDAEVVWLAVGGSYLYSHEGLELDVSEITESVVLRPVLGAWISGRLLAPLSDPSAELTGVEVELNWSNSTALQLGSASSERLDREALSDAEGRFELRAIPIGKPQTLETDSPTLAATFTEDVQPLPGTHVQVELPMLRGGNIRGRTLDGAGQPVAGVEILALGQEVFGNPSERLREIESDTEGYFALEGVTPGRTWLRMRLEGYQDVLSAPFELADGETREHGDIELDEGLAIAGTVVFPNGAPASGTHVKLGPDLSGNLAGTSVDPRAYIGARNDATADEQGAFRIAGLGPGPWVVVAELDVEEESAGGLALGRWSVSQGAVSAPAENLSLVLDEPVFVSGAVVDGVGEPFGTGFQIRGERAGIQWYMPPSDTREETFESEDGTFLMGGLREGDWTFTAVAEGYPRSAEVSLKLPSEERLALVINKPVRLAGLVVDPDGRPVAGAEVGKELEGAEVFEAMQGRGDWPVAKTDAEGKFVLEELTPGAGSVVAKKDGFAPSEPVAYELVEGEAKNDLRLVMRRGATLTGEVFGADGKPSGGCVIVIQMPTMQERRITNAASDGTFIEHGMTPGTWQVQAFPGINSLQNESGEAIEQKTLLAALKMSTVELVDETEAHVVLGEPPADPVRVHGRVTVAGEPVRDTLISFVPTDGGGMDRLKIKAIEDDGRYEVLIDEAGNYLVTIQTTATPGQQSSIELRRTIPSGEDHRLDFELPLGKVSGRVHDSAGQALAEERITLNMEGGLVFGTVFGGQYNETVTDENGEYEIPYLRPGHYAVAAGGARAGGILDTGDGHGRQVTTVEVKESQWVRGVDFELGKSGTIQGAVRDESGALVGGASIFVRDEDGHLVELFSVAQTNASGKFRHPGLAPGEYTVVARTSTQTSAAGVPVRVRSGETSDVTVTVQAGTILLVTLVDKSGADVPARVSVLNSEGREMNGMLGMAEIMERYSGGLGNAVQRVGPLPPGRYVVQAFAEDERTSERKITLKGEPERKAKLWLR